MKVLKITNFFRIAADASGLSFNDLYPMKFLRGQEVRKVESHTKVEVVTAILSKKKKRFILTVNASKPYSSEIKMLLPLLERMNIRARYFLGDRGYDSVKLMTKLQGIGISSVIQIREAFRFQAKNPLRILSRDLSNNKDLYKPRYLTESLFGNIKQKHTSHIFVKSLKMAEKYALLRLIAFNISFFFESLKSFLCLFILTLFDYGIETT